MFRLRAAQALAPRVGTSDLGIIWDLGFEILSSFSGKQIIVSSVREIYPAMHIILWLWRKAQSN
jgi:hypothetical protein